MILLKDILLQLPLVGPRRRLCLRIVGQAEIDEIGNNQTNEGNLEPRLLRNTSIHASIVLPVDPNSTLLELIHYESGKIAKNSIHFDFLCGAALTHL